MAESSKQGFFIVLEGPDGGGKSTQAAALETVLKEMGRPVFRVWEPGCTPVGEKIRDILLDPAYSEMTAMTELMLYMASRAQLVDEIVRPALEKGKVVISERFLLSSIVYQGVAGGLGRENVAEIGRQICCGIQPDLTIILDIDASTGLSRIKGGLDRIEQKTLCFHENVRNAYLNEAARDPEKIKIVDSSLSVREVSAIIGRIIKNVLQ